MNGRGSRVNGGGSGVNGGGSGVNGEGSGFGSATVASQCAPPAGASAEFVAQLRDGEGEPAIGFGRYKILFYFDAFVHDSIILLLPPPICIARTIAMLLYIYCAIYDAHPTPLLYATHHTILVMATSSKGQHRLGRSVYGPYPSFLL